VSNGKQWATVMQCGIKRQEWMGEQRQAVKQARCFGGAAPKAASFDLLHRIVLECVVW
jgi:hypothetical protein